MYLEFGRGIANFSEKSLTVPRGFVILKFVHEHFIHFYFSDELSLNVLSQFYCGSHKVYLNFWVTHFGGSDRVQIKVNISMFGWDCPSPLITLWLFESSILSNIRTILAISLIG